MSTAIAHELKEKFGFESVFETNTEEGKFHEIPLSLSKVMYKLKKEKSRPFHFEFSKLVGGSTGYSKHVDEDVGVIYGVARGNLKKGKVRAKILHKDFSLKYVDDAGLLERIQHYVKGEKNTYQYRIFIPYDYAVDSEKIEDRYALVITFRDFDSLGKVIRLLGQKNEKFKEQVKKKFVKEIEGTQSVKKLIWLYDRAPLFARKAVNKEILFKHILLLTEYDDTGIFSGYVDASSTLIRVMQGISDYSFLYDKLCENQLLIKRIYHNLNGSSKVYGVLTLSNKEIFTSILANMCFQLAKNNPDKLNFTNERFKQDSMHELDTEAFKSDSSKVYLRQYENREVTNVVFRNLHSENFDIVNETKLLPADEGKYLNPLDIVKYKLDNEVIAVPAIFLVDIAFRKKWEEINQIIRVGFDVLLVVSSVVLIFTGPGSLLLAISIFDLGLAAGDLTIIAFEEELRKTQAGRTFLEIWADFQITSGIIQAPLFFASGVQLLKIVSVQSRKFVLLAMTKVILEVNITNFTAGTLRVINYAEVVKIAGKSLEIVQKTKRLQDAGIIFVVGGTGNSKKATQVATLYKGEVIASGTIKEVQTTLKPAFKLKGEKLITYLDSLIIEFINGYTKEKILALPKGSRPDVVKYLSKDYIQKHLSKFEEGVSYMTKKSALDKWGRDVLGMPDNTQFVMTKPQMTSLLKEAKGDLTKIETELGIPPGSWANEELIRIDILKPKNTRIPNGNEFGANELWIPGGKLPKGYLEAVIDNIKKGNYTETKIEIK